MIGLALLFSFKTPTETVSVASTSTGTSTTKASPSTSAAAATPAATTASGVSGTYTGQSVSTPYGDVQVQIAVSNGTITDIVALSYPTGRESTQINAYAIPILRQEALAAQTASINMVSGATWTSQSYISSLQSAIDTAGI
jgi:uncharacterized protein with FMN-binding domain